MTESQQTYYRVFAEIKENKHKLIAFFADKCEAKKAAEAESIPGEIGYVDSKNEPTDKPIYATYDEYLQSKQNGKMSA